MLLLPNVSGNKSGGYPVFRDGALVEVNFQIIHLFTSNVLFLIFRIYFIHYVNFGSFFAFAFAMA